MVKSVLRLSGNLICNVFSMKAIDNLQTNFIIKISIKVSLFTLSQYNLHTNYSGNKIYHVCPYKPQTNNIISPYYEENTFFPVNFEFN